MYNIWGKDEVIYINLISRFTSFLEVIAFLLSKIVIMQIRNISEFYI